MGHPYIHKKRFVTRCQSCEMTLIFEAGDEAGVWCKPCDEDPYGKSKPKDYGKNIIPFRARPK